MPRRAAGAAPGTNVLDAVIEARAREVASSELRHVAHTMALEYQGVKPADLEVQIAERAAALSRTPRRLWDPDVTPRAVRGFSAQRGRST